jgi:dTDP-glucose 4,6-dehydratase
MRVLITGGVGFIGHHVVEHILKNTDWEVVLLDRLDLSGNLNRIQEVLEGVKEWKVNEFEDYARNKHVRERLSWVYHDFKAPIGKMTKEKIGNIHGIIHMGASTHVDRSIEDPMLFVMDNVVGTGNILEYLRNDVPNAWMVYFSTDEVFGPAPNGVKYKEWDRYRSGNPYAASKAGGEELCVAYENTYGLDIRITHTMNVYGERQCSEKFIPLVIKKILNREKVLIHANKEKTKSGSRFYIHARNVADALLFVIREGTKGEKYNIVGEKEVSNLQMALSIADILNKELMYEMVDFHSSRPGHDLRYALDGEKLEKMGWKIPMDFEESLKRTVLWTVKHKQWLI